MDLTLREGKEQVVGLYIRWDLTLSLTLFTNPGTSITPTETHHDDETYCKKLTGGTQQLAGRSVGGQAGGSRSVVGVASHLMGTFPGRSFVISLHPSSTYPIAPGDIEVFKDMKLTSLNLYNCQQLTGVFGLGWGMIRRWGQDWNMETG